MTLICILGFFSSILIGISLGLIGGGGSILTLPVLVYVFGVSPLLSTTYSLFIVGTTSLVGALSYMHNRFVCYKVAWLFMIPSLLGIYLTRQFITTRIPEHFTLGHIYISKDIAIMSFFGVIILWAAYSMIKTQTKDIIKTASAPKLIHILVVGTLIGMITGIVGIGGGFLIIPALVVFAKLPMKTAVGTSLLIIALKSLVGFAGDVSYFKINWSFLLGFTSFSIIGIIAGTYAARLIEADKLKKSFGWMILVMGLFIIIKELIIR